MSTIIAVHAPLTKLPGIRSLMSALSKRGAQIVFPEGFHLEKDSGFVPCTLNGLDAGFEYSQQALTAETRQLLFESRSAYAGYAASALLAGCLALRLGAELEADDQLMTDEFSILGWLRDIELPESGDELLRVPVTVLGPRGNDLLQLRLGQYPAGAYLAKRLVESIPLQQVPPALRLPNSRFVLIVRDGHQIVGLEPAEPQEPV